MAQVKVYANRDVLIPIRDQLSDVIHSCVVDALAFPRDKRAHRFFPLDPADFCRPAGRSERYTIIEISMFEGRSADAKRTLIRLLFDRIGSALGIAAADVEITISETPRGNWGFRGMTGDEATLSYKIEV